MAPINVLYLSYNGLDEPLVQSQVLPYLRRLVRLGHHFRLLTFEIGRPSMSEWSEIEQGIAWRAIGRAPGRVGLVRALYRANRVVNRLLKDGRVQIVHARSYLPAWLAMRGCSRHDIPWVFDMRGFWIDEKVLKGRLRRDTLRYRHLKRVEKRLLRHAAAIISLTEKAVPTLEANMRPEAHTPVVVIPTCVDLDRFRVPQQRQLAGDSPVLGYVGSLGNGYDANRTVEFFLEALRRYPGARALVITRSDASLLGELLRQYPKRVEIRSVDHGQVPEEISKMHFGLSFIEPDSSKDASCPTKLAEYLASGVPVVGNGDIGDVGNILRGHDVGVSLSAGESLELAFKEVARLLEDPHAVRRCRKVAEQVFSVDDGAKKYHEIYLACARSGQ